MNRVEKVFENQKAFITFITAGDPTLEQTEKYIVAMAENGVDLIEIGIPFSDPIAEGVVIQRSTKRALDSGTDLLKIFDMVASVRKKVDIPLVFLTYLNTIFTYGPEKFFSKCVEIGVEGVIVPDMPFEEQDEIKDQADKYGIHIITLIAPTSNQRIAEISKNTSGFIYLVSSMGVTGMRDEITTDLETIVSKIRENTNTPIAVGFGISNAEQAREITRYADGAIIGSAIVNIIEKYKEEATPYIIDFVSNVKREINLT